MNRFVGNMSSPEEDEETIVVSVLTAAFLFCGIIRRAEGNVVSVVPALLMFNFEGNISLIDIVKHVDDEVK